MPLDWASAAPACPVRADTPAMAPPTATVARRRRIDITLTVPPSKLNPPTFRPNRISRPRGPSMRGSLRCVITSVSAVLCRLVDYLLSVEYRIRIDPLKSRERYPATTYSPTPLPGQYHRRWWA